MSFIRYGTPAKIAVAHVCDVCKQPKPLTRVTVNGSQKSVCADCAKTITNVNKS